ncbi:hypothetical protein ACTOS9_21810 (plasmid) [Bacillus subtilis]|nr:hypothetical protein P5648_22100 [Bacillus subtilis]WGD72636.1 hypothetical protein P5645_22200 [Bacillus subtilis]WGD74625.1 hypothetical protein P5631_00215 [Bacillus subtilis]
MKSIKKQCPYCFNTVRCNSSGIPYDNECHFCKAQVKDQKGNVFLTENYNRSPLLRTHAVIDLQDAQKPVPELRKYHTLELMILLNYVRAERARIYSLWETFLKVKESSDIPGEFAKVLPQEIKKVQSDYFKWKSHMNVLENLLLERLGYIPERIDMEFIMNQLELMKSSSKDDPEIEKVLNSLTAIYC